MAEGTRTLVAAVACAAALACSAPTTPPRRIASASDHTCVVDATGSVSCWGWNMFGQLGSGDPPSDMHQSHAPRPVVTSSGPLSDIVEIASGEVHSCALDEAGGVFCWGDNLTGELGIGSDDFFSSIAERVSLPDRALRIACGGAHTCALLADGSVSCWGGNFFGQLGTGSNENSFVPVAVSHRGLRFIDLAAGHSHTCAIEEMGRAYCWGDNARGQLGDGTSEWRSSPTEVLAEVVFAQLDLGLEHSCGVTNAADVYCWGSDEFDQLGVDGEIDRHQPTRVEELADTAAIQAGVRHTCALSVAGNASCWGNNSRRQTSPADLALVPSPRPVEMGASIAALAPGGTHTCVLTVGDEVYCWGDGTRGQLGSDAELSAAPVLVAW